MQPAFLRRNLWKAAVHLGPWLIGKLRGQMDRGEQARLGRLPLPGQIKCGSVIGGGADDRQAEGDIHARIKRHRFEEDERLVVVHRHIPVARGGTMREQPGEGRVGDEWTDDVISRLTADLNGGGDDLLLLISEEPVLSRMGIECQNSDPRGRTLPFFTGLGGQLDISTELPICADNCTKN